MDNQERRPDLMSIEFKMVEYYVEMAKDIRPEVWRRFDMEHAQGQIDQTHRKIEPIILMDPERPASEEELLKLADKFAWLSKYYRNKSLETPMELATRPGLTSQCAKYLCIHLDMVMAMYTGVLTAWKVVYD